MTTEPRAANFDYDTGPPSWRFCAADEVARYFNGKANGETARPSRIVRLVLIHDRIWRHKRWPLEKRVRLCGKITDRLASTTPTPTG
jgi:hypothetical protein